MKGIPAPKKRKTTTVSAQDNVARISLLSEDACGDIRHKINAHPKKSDGTSSISLRFSGIVPHPE